MGLSLKSLAQATPFLTPVFARQDAINAQKQAAQDAQDETLRSNFFKGQANDRANDLNAAQVANLTDDGWSKPIAATGPNGEPILVQQDRRGNFRPAEIGAGGGPTRPSIPGVQATTSAPTPIGFPGGPSLASSIPKQAPAVPVPATTTTPLAGTSSLAGQIRPYVKPSAEPKIDTNSLEGIAAAKQKADNAAAARAAHAVPRIAAAPRIDPNSTAGITADSTKAANRAALKPGGMTGGMGSGGIGGLARQASAITEMGQANDMLTPYEQAIRNKTANYDGLDYFTGLRGKMYDAHGVVDQATHAAAFAHLNQVNPDLANYLRAAEMWSLADGALSGRSSDFRTKLDAFVSAIGPNAGAAQIDNTQKARTTRLAELHKFQPAMEGAAQRFIQPGSGGGTATKEQQLWDAAVAKYGQARVLKEYGPRPEDQE